MGEVYKVAFWQKRQRKRHRCSCLASFDVETVNETKTYNFNWDLYEIETFVVLPCKEPRQVELKDTSVADALARR